MINPLVHHYGPYYLASNVYITNWKDPPFLMGKSTIYMTIFNSELFIRGYFFDGTVDGLMGWKFVG